jgi:branched-chain amino acid aminotransferase
VSPTGNYFKNASAGLNLHLETRRCRASRGGTGNVKCAGNYAVALKPLMDAKPLGYDDNLFVDLESLYAPGASLVDAIIQEMSAANVFFVLPTGEICTPSLHRGTILPGVTRSSIIHLVNLYKDELLEAIQTSARNPSLTLDDVRAVERDVTVSDLLQAVEAFGTGTAAEIVPIARVSTSENDSVGPLEVVFPSALPGGPVTVKLLAILREAMAGQREEVSQWIRDPFATESVFCS